MTRRQESSSSAAAEGRPRHRDDAVAIRLTVNGAEVRAEVPADVTLQRFLHHQVGHGEVRYGCGEGACGACAVLLDDEPVASCLLLAVQADGRDVVTLAGLERAGEASPGAGAWVGALREHFLAAQSFQCGYCAAGMFVSADHHLRTGGLPDPDAVREALAGHLCRCTGYQGIVQAVVDAGSRKSPPPAPRPRADLEEKLGGTARYPSDGHVSDALSGRILWSEHPAARIVGIDVTRAWAVPGVEAVLTWRDIPGRNAMPSLFASDQPVLAPGVVRTMSDAVALVAARSEQASREAVRQILVRYEPLQPVTDVFEALQPGARRVIRRGNVASQFVERRGDVGAAFASADRVVEATFVCDMTDHSPIELEGGTGWLEGGTLCLATPCQTPFTVRRGVARMLRRPQERVRIVSPRMGGAFGRYLVPSIDPYLSLLVHATGKPVRLVLERNEVLGRRVKRHRFVGSYRLALRSDGTFLGLEADLVTDGGSYQSLTPTVISIFAFEAVGAYRFPAVSIRVRGVRTNNLPPAPERGFGSQQVNFGIDSLVEKAARTLGLDPVEVRRKNLRGDEDAGSEGPAGAGASGLAATLDALTQRLGPTPQGPLGWLVGRGIACVAGKYGYPLGLSDRAVARVAVEPDGRLTVEADLTDAGTGVTAQLTSLAADALGVATAPAYAYSRAAVADPTGTLLASGHPPSPVRRSLYRLIEAVQLAGSQMLVRVAARLSADGVHRLMRVVARPVNLFGAVTVRLKARLFPFGVDSFAPRVSGSRGIMMTGRAVVDACQRLRERVLALAASRLEVEAGALTVGDSGVWVTTDPSRSLSWIDLVREAGGELAAVGRASLPRGRFLDPRTGNQSGPADFMPASHGCDLAVHPETGEVRVLRYVAVHDVGRALNPDAVRGQVVGGVAMGVGQALFERLPVRDGRVEATGFRDYLLPTALDVPENVEVVILELGTGLGPHGAKGIGEAGAVAAPSAVANALYDALGQQVCRIPIGPEEIAEMASRERGRTWT